MKSFLLAGCATVALTGLCGTAAAGDTAPGKFDIKLGGDSFFAAGMVSQQGDTGMRSTDFQNRFRLVVTPKAVADNGMEYGATLRLRASLGSARIDSDQALIFVSGRFGLVEAGVGQGPNNQYNVIAPQAFGTGGIDGDWAAGDAGWIKNQNTFLEPYFGGGYDNITNTNVATRINYFTPRFFAQEEDNTGLMGSFAYVPVNRSVNTGVDRVRVSSTSPAGATTYAGSNCPTDNAPPAGGIQGCSYSNIVEFGLRYDGSFKGVSLKSSAGYILGEGQGVRLGADSGTRNIVTYNGLEAVQFGAQVGYAGFTVGGSYLNAGQSGYARTITLNGQKTYLSDQEVYTAGISYETGPVIIGFNYIHGRDAGDVNVPGARNADMYAVGATYTVAPGLTTALEYVRSETQNEAGFQQDALGNNRVGSGNADLVLWKTTVTF